MKHEQKKKRKNQKRKAKKMQHEKDFHKVKMKNKINGCTTNNGTNKTKNEQRELNKEYKTNQAMQKEK